VQKILLHNPRYSKVEQKFPLEWIQFNLINNWTNSLLCREQDLQFFIKVEIRPSNAIYLKFLSCGNESDFTFTLFVTYNHENLHDDVLLNSLAPITPITGENKIICSSTYSRRLGPQFAFLDVNSAGNSNYRTLLKIIYVLTRFLSFMFI